MSVYKNDKPENFRQAIYSIYNQTVMPDEIVLVVDGPVGDELEREIGCVRREIPILKVLRLRENKGHAIARQIAIDNSKNDLVAIMDSDDVSVPDRFRLQLAVLRNNPDISVVGGLINEFTDSPENIVSRRVVPEFDSDIKQYMKRRCPLNFVTVMMRRSDLLSVGGIKDWYCEEDYYLWVRFMLAGYKFYNIQDNLVDVRIGEDTYKRRGSVKYFKSEVTFQRYMLNNKVITYSEYVLNIAIRLFVQIILPNKLRAVFYRKFARS